MRKIYLSISLLLSIAALAQQSTGTSDVLENKLDFINKNTTPPVIWSFKDYTKEGNVEVSTGTFGISIPFFEIKEENLDIPIGISYKTSGVKVQQNSSEVGINWELMAGAAITRTVKGHPDERKDISNPASLGGSQRYIFARGATPEKLNNYFDNGTVRVFTASAAHNGYIYTENVARSILNRNREQFPRSGYVPPNERESSIAQVMYETNFFGKDDYEQDIFTVNLGKSLFHFSFKLATATVYDMETGLTRVEGTSLDEKGYRITVYISNPAILPYDSRTNIISSIIIKDKQGIEYRFSNYEKTENEYIFDYYRYPFSPWIGSEASPAIIFGDVNMNSNVNNQEYRNQVVQHLMKELSVNKWNISKIILPRGKEINFTYSTSTFIENNVQQRIHDGEFLNYENNTKPKFNARFHDVTKNYTYKNYLNSINSDNFKIDFEYDSYRPDYYQGGFSLNKVTVKNNLNQIAKIFKLVKQFSNAEQVDASDDYRMFLSELQEWNTDNTFNNKYSFSYNNPDNLPCKNFLAYSDLFGYYLGNRGNPGTTTNLAFPMVYLYPYENHGERISYEPYSGSTAVQTNGVDRRPNGNQVSLGVLNKITFPTKGTLDITYEPNTYYFPKGQNQSPYGPGVRVKRLEYKDDQQQKLIKEYSYNSGGTLLFKPSYAYIGNFADNNAFNQDITIGKNAVDFMNLYRGGSGFSTTGNKLKNEGLSDAAVIKKMIILSNKNIGPQFDLFGREIIYTNVLEKTINTTNQSESFSKKYFNYYEDNSPEVNVVSGPTDESTFIPPASTAVSIERLPWKLYNVSDTPVKMSYGFAEKKGKNIFPFPDRDYFGLNNELKNGKTYLIESFDANNNKVLSEEFDYDLYYDPNRNISDLKSFNIQLGTLATHVYDSTDPQKKFLEDIALSHYYNRFHRSMFYYITKANYYERSLRLKSTKRTQYFPSGNSLQEITNLDYSPYQYDLISQKSMLPEGGTLEKRFKYINDISPGNNDYTSFGLTGIPLVIEIFKNNKQTSKTKVAYGRDWIGHEHMLPSKIESIKTSTINASEEIANQMNITQYDNRGNILEYSTESNIPTTMIWGYNQTLPIAKIEGSAYSNINQYTADIIAKSNADTDLPTEQALINALDVFRKNPALANYQITTYTYNPLIGVTSITPPSGMREIYIYDTANKLKEVKQMQKDSSGNFIYKTVKENNYNYKQ